MKSYSYKKTIVTTKKLSGVYNTTSRTITSRNIDGDIVKDVLEELRDFNGNTIEIVVRKTEETDLDE